MIKQSSRVWLCLVTRRVYIGRARALGHCEDSKATKLSADIDKPIYTMGQQSSAGGVKRSTPCESNEVNETVRLLGFEAKARVKERHTERGRLKQQHRNIADNCGSGGPA